LELILYAKEVEDAQSLNWKTPAAEELHCSVNFSDYDFDGGETVAIAISEDNIYFIC
jgi:hypothetical protein